MPERGRNREFRELCGRAPGGSCLVSRSEQAANPLRRIALFGKDDGEDASRGCIGHREQTRKVHRAGIAIGGSCRITRCDGIGHPLEHPFHSLGAVFETTPRWSGSHSEQSEKLLQTILSIQVVDSKGLAQVLDFSLQATSLTTLSACDNCSHQLPCRRAQLP